MNKLHACPKQENRKRDVHKHNNRESTLNAVSEVATDCNGTKAERATKLCNIAYKGKRGTDLQQCVQRQQGSTGLSDLSLSRWLDDAAIQDFMSSHGCRCGHRHRRYVHRLTQL